MGYLLITIHAVMLFALVVEIILRSMERFSSKMRERFRIGYVIGCVACVLMGIVLTQDRLINEGLRNLSAWYLIVPAVALVITIGLSKKTR